MSHGPLKLMMPVVPEACPDFFSSFSSTFSTMMVLWGIPWGCVSVALLIRKLKGCSWAVSSLLSPGDTQERREREMMSSLAGQRVDVAWPSARKARRRQVCCSCCGPKQRLA